MKQFILGFASAVAVYISVPSATSLITYHFPPEKDSKWQSVAMHLEYHMYLRPDLFGVFMDRCTKDIRRNGHSWVFVSRDYFECNKLEILISDLIYGEKTYRSEEDKKEEVCTDCKL